MQIRRLDASVATVMSCLVERRKREGHRLNEYTNTYGRMLEVATREMIGNVR